MTCRFQLEQNMSVSFFQEKDERGDMITLNDEISDKAQEVLGKIRTQ